MNRFWLKIVGGTVFALAAAVVAYMLWPAQAPPLRESKDTEQVQKEDKHNPEALAKVRQPAVSGPSGQTEFRQAKAAESGRRNQLARRAYRRSLIAI